MKKTRKTTRVAIRYMVMLLTVAVIGSFGVLLTSCKDDEPSPPRLSLSETSIEVNEADGVIEIEFTLDKPAPKDITVEYDLDGDAVEYNANGTEPGDYEITGDAGEFEIEEGETTGIIEIEIFSDLEYEEEETIVITIDDVTEGITLPEENEIEITIMQEDGLGIILDWGYETGDNYTDVDMDLFLWIEDDAGVLEITNIAAAAASFTSPEQLFIPDVVADGTYGISANYYEGSEDAMKFRVQFYQITSGGETLISEKAAVYTLANRNPWVDTEVPPSLAMTWEKSGSNYTAFSEITVPAEGSRIKTSSWPSGKKPEKK